MLYVILRFILLSIAPTLSFVLFQAEWRCLGHGGRFPLAQQLPLPLNVLPLRVDSLLLPRTCNNKVMYTFFYAECIKYEHMFVLICMLT